MVIFELRFLIVKGIYYYVRAGINRRGAFIWTNP